MHGGLPFPGRDVVDDNSLGGTQPWIAGHASQSPQRVKSSISYIHMYYLLLVDLKEIYSEATFKNLLFPS